MYMALCTSEENTILGQEITFLSVFTSYVVLTFNYLLKSIGQSTLHSFFLEYSLQSFFEMRDYVLFFYN